MALFSRIGNVLRRTSASTSSPLLQPVRCMSSKVYVGGISYATDETTLKNAFSQYGNVLEARIIADRDSGRSKGFGFVTFTSAEEASAAITNMDGKELQGRNIRVNHANDRAGGIRGGGGFGAGGGYPTGGYGSGGGGGYPTGGYGGGGGGYPTGGYGGGSGGGGGYSSGGGGGYPTGGYGGGGGGGYNSGGYAGNGGYSVGSGSGDGGNYNNASGGGYSGNDGYGDETNFAGNVTGGGYGSSTGEFCGGGANYGANKPQYSGKDNLPSDFFDKEVAEGI